jgi:NAD(P)H-flavin reductase
MSIQKINGVVSNVTDLSPTAKEVTITLEQPMTFIAGCFVNIFMEDQGETIRRAFSIASEDGTHTTFTLAIRHSLQGRLSPLFWQKDMIGSSVSVMGPLGLNTADKMHSKRIFLFGFGIGVGVVKSLATHFVASKTVDEITIATGSRNDDDVMYKEYFDTLAANDSRVKVRYVVSAKDGESIHPTGYIQDHIDDMDFSNADVYVCGQEIACTGLQEKVKESKPENCSFFVEDFH